MRVLAVSLILVLATPVVAESVVISELLPDPDGRDDGNVFVELYGPAFTDLTGWVLQGLNGNGGAVTHQVSLDGFTIPEDGFLVIADAASGVTSVADADVVVDDFDLQNGPDSVRLLAGTMVIDAVAYGTFGTGLLAFGEGDPASSPGAGVSLSRRWVDVDTNDNATDFELSSSPTPGRGKLAAAPEPASLALVLLGGIGLAAVRVTRSRRAGRRATRR